MRDLRTEFHTKEGVVRAVNGVSLSVDRGKVLGVMGESGCGKTVTGLSILNLVPFPGRVIEGVILFEGRDLRNLNREDLRRVRGKEIAMVFQDATAGLNPILTVGTQIEEMLTSHLPISKREARGLSVEALSRMGLPDPAQIVDRYTFQLSGGMCQRVMLAMSLALDPKVLIADEPTTGLDVTLQAEILNQIRTLKDKLGSSIILISHDLGVIAQMADEVIVMYAGYVVERADVKTLFQRPMHPYTWALMQSIPRLDQPVEGRLRSLQGAPPDLLDLGPECPFMPRCNKTTNECRIEPMPPLVELEPGHLVASYNPIRHDWN